MLWGTMNSPGPRPGRPNGRDEGTVGGQPVHRGVPVAVGDEQLAGGGHADIGRMVERRLEGRAVSRADGRQQLPIRRVFQDLVGVPVHEVHGVVGPDVDMVGVGGYAVRAGPGGHRVPVTVEHQHRWPLPLEHVDPILAIDGDGR